MGSPRGGTTEGRKHFHVDTGVAHGKDTCPQLGWGRVEGLKCGGSNAGTQIACNDGVVEFAGPHLVWGKVEGSTHSHFSVEVEPVYDGEGWAPDISRLSPRDRLIWVLAEWVWSKKRVVRQIGPTELLAVWDYEGKHESRHWDAGLLEKVLTSRLKSPPSQCAEGCGVSSV